MDIEKIQNLIAWAHKSISGWFCFKDAGQVTHVSDFNIPLLKSKLPVAANKIADQIDVRNYPRRPECNLSLNEKSSLSSHLTYGSAELSGEQK